MRISDLFHFLRQVFLPNWKSEENDEPSRFAEWSEAVGKRFRSHESIGTLVSVLLHILILLLLSYLLLPNPHRDGLGDILGGTNPLPKELAKKDSGNDDVTIETDKPPGEDSGPQASEVKPEIMEPEQDQPTPASMGRTEEATPIPEPGETEAAPNSGKRQGFVSGGGFEGRTAEGRMGTGGLGGNDGGVGENSVEAGLGWLAAHQNKADGSWSFELKCCANEGNENSRTAATALALLPFLGAGYTHERGKYQKLVADGLYFLRVQGAASEMTNTVDYQKGLKGMYDHGLAAIVLCEAHAMSRRKLPGLRDAAQGAIDFIERAQDQRLGGWRYKPNQSPGDLSVTAWQIMALKSATLADLHVSQQAIYWASDFLDAVALDGGRQYNYLPERKHFSGDGPDSQRTCNATGLLLRMYLGWEPGEKMLDEGIEMIEQFGPLRPSGDCCLYYAYYATLAMHHYGGSDWNRWASELSRFLVDRQAKHGHESGSWFFPDRHTDVGGRLLNTALAILILETPYRILPLYRKR